MGICAAVNCSHKNNKAKNIVLYRLSKDKTIQKQWLANLKERISRLKYESAACILKNPASNEI